MDAIDQTTIPSIEPQDDPVNDRYVSLGERMKTFETDIDHGVPPYHSFIVRIDGKNFSKFTKNFKKPYDPRFQELMNQTAEALLDYFQPSTCYVQSDEISLVFPKLHTKSEYDSLEPSFRKNHLFNGRILKLTSLIASQASVKFNQFLNLIIVSQVVDIHGPTSDDLTIKGPLPIFDARIMQFSESEEHEIVNNLIWRSEIDSHRNCALNYGVYRLGHKTIHGKNVKQIIEMLRTVGLDWENDVPDSLKFGVFVKKTLRPNEAGYIRSYPVRFTARLTKLHTDRCDTLKMLMDKHYVSEIVI